MAPSDVPAFLSVILFFISVAAMGWITFHK